MRLEDLLNNDSPATTAQFIEETAPTYPDYLINDPQVVGYPDEDMQQQIYRWIGREISTDTISGRDQDSKIILRDFGAGRGDFMPVFFQSVGKRRGEYIGIETNPNLCSVAQHKYDGINILNESYFENDMVSDYTVVIGTLNESMTSVDDPAIYAKKWDLFNRTLTHAMRTTRKKIIFVLARNMDGHDEFLDYPLHELFVNIDPNIRLTLDYSEFQDIYKLTVHIGSFN